MAESNDRRVEVPWFDRVPEATLAWEDDDPTKGWLHFVDPKGNKHSIPVTTGPTIGTGTGFGNVWHVDIGGEQATVSPSVHYVGEWHSPNPVVFSLVDKLPGDD